MKQEGKGRGVSRRWVLGGRDCTITDCKKCSAHLGRLVGKPGVPLSASKICIRIMRKYHTTERVYSPSLLSILSLCASPLPYSLSSSRYITTGHKQSPLPDRLRRISIQRLNSVACHISVADAGCAQTARTIVRCVCFPAHDTLSGRCKASLCWYARFGTFEIVRCVCHVVDQSEPSEGLVQAAQVQTKFT